MRLEGKFALKAPIQKVWDFLLDPSTLFSCIPGAEKIEKVPEDDGPKDEHRWRHEKISEQPPDLSLKHLSGREGDIVQNRRLALLPLNEVGHVGKHLSDNQNQRNVRHGIAAELAFESREQFHR